MLLAVLAWSHPGFGAESSREYQVKAAFLFNFTKFIEWPVERFATPTNPVVIGVFGKNPFGNDLSETVKGKTNGNRSFMVRVVSTPAEATNCHLVFLPAGEDKVLAEMQPLLVAAGVITVGETELFARQQGVINFVMEAGKLRFDLNMETADHARLKINAQLQQLARKVHKKT